MRGGENAYVFVSESVHTSPAIELPHVDVVTYYLCSMRELVLTVIIGNFLWGCKLFKLKNQTLMLHSQTVASIHHIPHGACCLLLNTERGAGILPIKPLAKVLLQLAAQRKVKLHVLPLPHLIVLLFH